MQRRSANGIIESRVSSPALPPDIGDIEAARVRIRGVAMHTPCERAAWLSERAGHDVFLKLECWQRTGSFKIRGALNAVATLGDEARSRGIVTASAGNHGQAVALACRLHGLRATVFVPRSAPAAKKSRIRAHGATLDESARDYDAAEDVAMAYAREIGATFVHPYSDDAVVAGQGTVGLEILEDVPDVRTIMVPVGGGGLAAGTATVTEPHGVRVVGVQSDTTTNMHAALAAGGVLVDCPILPTLADGLAGRTNARAVERCLHLLDDMLLVAESSIGPAMRNLFVNHGVVAEGAGAVGAAAIESLDLRIDGPTVIVITGRNLDAATLCGVLEA